MRYHNDLTMEIKILHMSQGIQMETMPELCDIGELPEGTFPLSFKLIEHYQRKDPILTEKLNPTEYIKSSFRGGRNTIKFVTFKDKLGFPQLI